MDWQTLVASATSNSNSKPSTLTTNDYQGYSDDDEYTDDDYESVEMAAWGDNAKQEEPASWNNLIDNSIKLKAGGVGSGDLHRRGGNFKPLSEAAILAQRLSKPIPGKKNPAKPPGVSSKKKKKKSTKPPIAMNSTSKFTSARKSYTPAPIYKLPERKPAPNAPPSTWGSKPLVETPFWEVQRDSVPPPSTPVPVTSSNNVNTAPSEPTKPLLKNDYANFNTSVKPVPIKPESVKSEPVKGELISVGVNTSFIFTNPNITTTNTNNPITDSNMSTLPNFNPEAPGFVPSTKVKNTANSKWNTEAPAFNPSPSSTLSTRSSNSNMTASSTVKSTFNANAPDFLPFIQLPIKTSVKMSTPTPTPPVTRLLSSTAKSNPLLSKQLDNIQKSVSRENEKPYVTITLEIAEGISAVINLYQDSDPVEVAEEFGKKHNLIVADTTKKNLARTFTQLLNAKKNKEQLRHA